MKPEPLEKYTSALTLSDMEIFVFPELMYSLLLANLMSPVIWRWRDLDCFKKLEGKSSYRKLMRLKQFIIDEFEFNLDLETWGLTSKGRHHLDVFVNYDRNLRLQYLAGEGFVFGKDDAELIYQDMTSYRTWPNALFTGSPKRLKALRKAILGS